MATFYTPTNSGVRRLPSYSSGIAPSGDINASNLAYVRGGISSDPTAGVTADLLNPNWGPAVYDTEKRGAELAVGGGYRGSPLASYQTSRMRAADIERRAALANSLLSGSRERIPAPADQVSIRGQDIAQNQFQQRQNLAQEQFDWEKQQKNLATQQAAGYRYQSGPRSYQPLPQYMRSGGGDYMETVEWGPGQTGPNGQVNRFDF